MGNVLVAPPKTDHERMRRVEHRLNSQISKIRGLIKRDDSRILRLSKQLEGLIEKKSTSKLSNVEKERIASEISFLMNGQEALTKCYEHVSQLVIVVRQLKTGRFSRDVAKSVQAEMSSLKVSFETSAADSSLSVLVEELQANNTSWHTQKDDIANMVSGINELNNNKSQSNTAVAALEIIQEMESDIKERNENNILERDRRFRELKDRTSLTQRGNVEINSVNG